MSTVLGFSFGRSRRRSRKYLLDALGAAAVGAYSLRRLKQGYAGPAVRVRRSSNNAEQDIGFAGTTLDVTALLAFVGAGDGFVVTFYDQSGNGRDLVQATAANQPPIVLSGAYLSEIRVQSGTIQTLAVNNAAFDLMASAATFSSVLGTTSVGPATIGTIWALGGTIGARLVLGVNGSVRNLVLRPGGTNLVASPIQTLPASGAIITLTKTATANASACTSRLNGSAASTYPAEAIATGATSFGIGRAGVNDNGAHGHRELIVWNTLLAGADLQTLERNQGTAFGIAVP